MTIQEQLQLLAQQGMTRTRAAQTLNIAPRQLAELAAECGVTFRKRGEFCVDGVWGTEAEHAARLGLSIYCLRWRRKHGKIGVERKTRVTPEEVDAYVNKRMAELAAEDAAAAVGRPYNTLRRLASQRPEYQHLLAQLEGTRRKRVRRAIAVNA